MQAFADPNAPLGAPVSDWVLVVLVRQALEVGVVGLVITGNPISGNPIPFDFARYIGA